MKLELPGLVNDLVSPVAKRAGETLVDIWDIVFINVGAFAEKQRLTNVHNLKSFKTQLESKISNIPPENIIEPPISIVGPTLESSKYYYNEPKLREMFANLVAASIDKTKSDDLHPSFPQIIQNLSPKDAEFLNVISNKFSLAYCQLRYQKREKPNFSSFFSHFGEGNTITNYLLEFYYPDNPLHDFSSTIDNLSRLKLIEILDDKQFIDINRYAELLDNPIYLYNIANYINPYENPSESEDKEVTMIKGIINITAFGHKFISVCV